MLSKLVGILFQPRHLWRFDFSNRSSHHSTPRGPLRQRFRSANALFSPRTIPIWAVTARIRAVSGLLWTAGKPPMAAAQTPQLAERRNHRHNYIGLSRSGSTANAVPAGESSQ